MKRDQWLTKLGYHFDELQELVNSLFDRYSAEVAGDGYILTLRELRARTTKALNHLKKEPK
jgi:hypothetical protein